VAEGLSAYATPGWGGRQPVSWNGLAPNPAYPLDGSVPRPVVAVLDTPIGRHPWLGRTYVRHDVTVLDQPVGHRPATSAAARAEATGMTEGMVAELGPDSGHGTFIAGLVRQACPEALVLDVPLFGNDGVVAESDLLRALQLLALRQTLARRDALPDRLTPSVDILVMALGYYHEQPEDAAFDALLRGPIDLLGRLGVAVVVSAGNDATQRPIFPAAFAPYPKAPAGETGDDPRVVPVTAVGALNPDSTIALFSNDGPWVRFHRPGASLVSTMPTTYDASLEPSNAVRNERGEWRTGLDPDDFSCGFGVWSGTSFAAPVFAGQLAAALAARLAEGDPTDPVTRLRELLDTMPGAREPEAGPGSDVEGVE
jgi:subtilisin family serine protease